MRSGDCYQAFAAPDVQEINIKAPPRDMKRTYPKMMTYLLLASRIGTWDIVLLERPESSWWEKGQQP